MKAIFEPVYNTAGVEQLNKELAKDGGRTVMVSGCIDTQKLHFSSAIASNYNFQLVITSDEGKARDMAEDARFFNSGNVMYYPAKDVIFYNADVQGRQIAGERIRCIAAIIDRLNKSDMEMLELAIRCHNMYRIPQGLNRREQAFCNVLRDADKVDIFKVNIDTPLEEIYNTTTEELMKSDITDEVLEAFDEEHCILKAIRRTPADTVIGHVSLAYELVYDESVRITVEQGYLGKLMHFHSDNEETNRKMVMVREKMDSYVKKRIGEKDA